VARHNERSRHHCRIAIHEDAGSGLHSLKRIGLHRPWREEILDVEHGDDFQKCRPWDEFVLPDNSSFINPSPSILISPQVNDIVRCELRVTVCSRNPVQHIETWLNEFPLIEVRLEIALPSLRRAESELMGFTCIGRVNPEKFLILL